MKAQIMYHGPGKPPANYKLQKFIDFPDGTSVACYYNPFTQEVSAEIVTPTKGSTTAIDYEYEHHELFFLVRP